MQQTLRANFTSVASRRAARTSVKVSAVFKTKSEKSSTTKSITEGKEYLLNAPGVCEPTGFWDPLGFTDSPTFTISEAKRFREAELTHGRVAMLATLGWVVQEEYHPFFPSEGGPAFRHFQEVESVFPQFWEIVLFGIGLCETYRAACGWNPPGAPASKQMREDYTPGQIGFDPLGLFPEDDPEKAFNIQTKEINNGRLAMIAWTAFAVQEEVNKQTIWKDLVTSHFIPKEEANLLPY